MIGGHLMLLENKNAIVYGGAGAIGSAVARAFAGAGARVHLAGRTLHTLQAVADDIHASGGAAEVARVDALYEVSVDQHADDVATRFGSIDISICLIDVGDVQGTPLADMSLADFEQPISNAVRSAFITSRAAARHMIRQRSGVIVTFGGNSGGDPIRDYHIGGFQVALGAVDVLRRQLAAELGRFGVRVVAIQTGGLLETLPKDFPGRPEIEDLIVGPTMLKRAATLDEVGKVSVFAASELAAAMTGTSLNITCGAVVD
jgi:NAD(P)-dependent dehydrogenase (short-subunit alcohol dehydrogenase family)